MEFIEVPLNTKKEENPLRDSLLSYFSNLKQKIELMCFFFPSFNILIEEERTNSISFSTLFHKK